VLVHTPAPHNKLPLLTTWSHWSGKGNMGQYCTADYKWCLFSQL